MQFSLLGIDVWGWVAIGAGVIAALYALRFWRDKMRRDNLAQLAAAMDFEFRPRADELASGRYGHCSLFDRGDARRVRNALIGKVADLDVHAFDYHYALRRSTGKKRSSTTHRQTVIAIRTPGIELPTFSLEREGLFDRIAQSLGRQDIDFDQHPQFSKRFELRGDDEQAVRQLFTPGLVEHFTRTDPNWKIEGAGEWIFFYREHRRIAIKDLQDAIDEVSGHLMAMDVSRFNRAA